MPAVHALARGARSALALFGLTLCTPLASTATDISAECRGVAAGVVSAMRAAGEVQGDAAIDAAIVAARRACSAAREGLGAPAQPDAGGADAAAAQDAAPAESGDEPSLWDLLTRDVERKPGNDRLRRLKQ